MANNAPDFRPTNTNVDPQAFANVLQRRSAIELEQANFREQQRQKGFQELINAVTTGQQIASNMMTLAEKRRQNKATEDISAIINEPSADPILQPTREQRLIEAVSRRSPELVDKAIITASMPEQDKNFAPQQITFQNKKTNKPEIGILKNGRIYWPNTNTEIPAELFGGKGFKSSLVTDSAGNVKVVSGAGGETINTIDTSAPGTQEPKNEANNIFVLPAPRRAEFVKTVEATKNDSDFKGERQKIVNAATFERSLAAKNQILDSGAPLQFRKVFGDAGNISIVEQQASEGDRQVFARAKQFAERNLKSGKLTEHNREIMRAGLKVLRTSAEKNLLLQTEIQAKGMKAQYPELSERLIAENILGKDIYTNLKKKYPDVADTLTGESNNVIDKQVNDFFNSILGGK